MLCPLNRDAALLAGRTECQTAAAVIQPMNPSCMRPEKRASVYTSESRTEYVQRCRKNGDFFQEMPSGGTRGEQYVP